MWKSTQLHPLLGIYKYPAIASTPQLTEDKVILRETNSHGGNEGQARHLVYLDKATGKTLFRRFAGHIDYRTRYAPVATDGRFTVYPFGVHDIYGYPAICQNFNRLICADADNSRVQWDINIGDIDALVDPVLTEGLAICGTEEGYVYGLRLEGKPVEAWAFQANGSVNTTVAVDGGRIYFGANGGTVYCLEAATGKLVWSTAALPVEANARKQFSTALVQGDRIYLGGANRKLFCLAAANGALLWERTLSDWVRARPVATATGLYAATVDGRMHCLDPAGRILWSRQVSTHPIYADLVLAGDRILLNDSHLYFRCLDLNGQELWKKSLVLAAHTGEGERIYTDEISGGTYYQSKPTAWQGKLFFGNPAGFLYALDAASGQEIWKFEMGGGISVGPAVADGKVYAGQQGGERYFYCLDAASGRCLWKQALPGGWVWGSAAVDDGLVYVPTVSGYAVCLDGATGHIVWMYPTAKSVPAEPAVFGDLVYFGSWSHALYAFQKKTGSIVWKSRGAQLDSGTLIATGGEIYHPDGTSMFQRLDASSGEVLSRGITDPGLIGPFTNFNATPAIHGTRGYYTARVGTGLRGVPMASRVFCVDLEASRILWTFPDGGGLSAPALAQDRLYIGSGNTPFLYCLNGATGEPWWIYRLGNRLEEPTLCIYRDKLYALAADGYLHAVE